MNGPHDPDPYYQAVEEAFNRRRGAPLLLSPRDWALIGAWKEAGIPLRIVLQGIENVFDAFARRAPTARRINALSYCRQEVLTLHELYLGLHGVEAGRPADAGAAETAAALGRHLGRLSRRLKEALVSCSAAGLDGLVGPLAEAAAAVRRVRKGLKSSPDPAGVERDLDHLDRALIEAAWAALTPPEREAIAAESEAVLAGSSDRMTPAALEATRRAAESRLIRRRFGLPRLSLFD